MHIPHPGAQPRSKQPGTQLIRLACALSLGATSACNITIDLNGDGTNPSPDGTFTSAECRSNATPLPRPSDGIWTAVTLNDVMPGGNYVCGNGDPYKFFVQYNAGATDLTITLEPGGACWDHQSCSRQVGYLSPRTLGGVTDDMMTNINIPGSTPWAAGFPHLGRIDNSVPTNKYNHVFFPYCTGDAFTGNVKKDYTDENGANKLTIHHYGRRNLEAAVEWLKKPQQFPPGNTGQLLVIGSSAGAVGAAANYPLFKDSLAPVCGAMVADAGPVFPPKGGQFGGLYPPYQDGPQKGLLDKVAAAWDLKAPSGLATKLDARFGNQWYRRVKDHFGHLNRGLARAYPNDRFLFTTFKQDLNFSLFSFVASGVIPPGDDVGDDVIAMWQTEVEAFRQWIDNDSSQNWGYYLPNYRPDRCSHMVATSPLSLVHDTYGYAYQGIQGRANGYHRTEIGSIDFGDALRQLLDRDADIPRVAAGDSDQLSFTNFDDGDVVIPSESWYDTEDGYYVEDKAAYVEQQLEQCVFTNGYPN